MTSARRKSNLLNNISDMEEGYNYSQAYNEASRCLLCYDAPCSKDCPANTDPATFIRKFRFRNVKGAVKTIKDNNMLGGVCGVVCPTDQLCQKACSFTDIERPIEIGKLQRFLIEHAREINFNPVEAKPSNNIKVAIIGSGPAGLSCAAELAREGFKPTIFEAKSQPGGVLRYGIPDFRLDKEFLDKELDDLKNLGVEFKCNQKMSSKDIENLFKEGFKSVFLATGIWESIRLNVPGADLENVCNSLEFLEMAKNGQRSKIEALVKDKNVALMGGGSVAMDVANTCKGLGANKVYIIYRRTMREMPASKHDLQMALDNYVIIRPLSTVTEFVGQEGKLCGLKGIEYDWKVPGVFTPSNLVTVPGTEFNLKVDLFVFAIGSKPAPENKNLIDCVEHTDNGLIKVKEDGVTTSDSRILAGGDIIRGSGTVVQAIADGKMAAEQIVKSLSKCKV